MRIRTIFSLRPSASAAAPIGKMALPMVLVLGVTFGALAQTTERVSVDSSGAEANDFSREPAISADGRFVAFSSNATNLVVGDTNATPDIFVHDRQTGTTEP